MHFGLWLSKESLRNLALPGRLFGFLPVDISQSNEEITEQYLKIRNFTESQNHRMVGDGRDLCGSSNPTLLLKQGHLQQAAEDLV